MAYQKDYRKVAVMLFSIVCYLLLVIGFALFFIWGGRIPPEKAVLELSAVWWHWGYWSAISFVIGLIAALFTGERVDDMAAWISMVFIFAAVVWIVLGILGVVLAVGWAAFQFIIKMAEHAAG